MRISDNAFSANFISNVNLNKNRINDLQNQLSSGLQFTAPSERPIDGDLLIHVRELQDRNDQYTSNIESASDYLGQTSNALSQMVDLYQQVVDTVAQVGRPGAIRDYPTYSDTLDGLVKRLISLANTSYNGKYLFGGTQTIATDDAATPYQLDDSSVDLADNFTVSRGTDLTDNSDENEIKIPVGEGIDSRMNVSGKSVFGQDGQAFTNIIDIVSAMDEAYQGIDPTDSGTLVGIDPEDFKTYMANVRQSLDNLISQNQTVGLDLETLDTLHSKITDDKNSLEQLRSSRQDTDIASTVVELNKQQVQLEAAYKMGANILPKSLVNFLH